MNVRNAKTATHSTPLRVALSKVEKATHSTDAHGFDLAHRDLERELRGQGRLEQNRKAKHAKRQLAFVSLVYICII